MFNSLKKQTNISLLFLTLLSLTIQLVKAQQLPFYSQYKTNMFMINPGITGTKRTVDIRLNNRMQWVGYSGAPRSLSFSAHNRFYKGKMGAGVAMVQDEIGPYTQMDLSGTFAYHIRFPDVEVSVGARGHYTRYGLDGNKVTLHHTQDPAIDQNMLTTKWVPNASFGFYMYNDRFHFGFSALRFIEPEVKLYKKTKDNDSAGIFKQVTHGNVSLGYNYSSNIDYVLENTLYVNYVVAAPILVDYTVRLHYLNRFFAGMSFRLRDAIVLHAGATFYDCLQISYSYDMLTSNLKPYNKGTHEITLAFSHNFKLNKGKFVHQRYAYMF